MADAVYNQRQWQQVTLQVLERDGWVCQLCGKPIPRHGLGPRDPLLGVADHVVATRAGGAWFDLRNLRAAHYGCNRRRALDAVRRRGGKVYPVPRSWVGVSDPEPGS